MMSPMRTNDPEPDLSALPSSDPPKHHPQNHPNFKFVYDAILLHEFKSVQEMTRDENEWYGPWSSLLHRLFPPQEGFQFTYERAIANRTSNTECTFYFLLKVFGRFIACIVEIKSSHHYHYPKLRINAYERLKDRLEVCLDDEIAGDIDTIYGLSCFGSRFMVMKMDTRTSQIQPSLYEEYMGREMAKVAPIDWWRHKAMTKEGCIRLHRLVEDVKKSLNKKHKLISEPVPVPLEDLSDDGSGDGTWPFEVDLEDEED